MSLCITSIIETTKGFLVQPTETFQQHDGTSLARAFQYYAALSLFYAILFGIVEGILFYLDAGSTFAELAVIGSFMGLISWVFVFFLFVFAFTSCIFGIFFYGLFQHVFVLLCGGERGVAQTVKAMMYASVPALVLGWIPIINVIAAIWSLVLMVIGVRELHKLSTTAAAVVVLLPIVLTFAIIILFALFFLLILGLGAAEIFATVLSEGL
jgi:hypothetical protein